MKLLTLQIRWECPRGVTRIENLGTRPCLRLSWQLPLLGMQNADVFRTMEPRHFQREPAFAAEKPMPWLPSMLPSMLPPTLPWCIHADLVAEGAERFALRWTFHGFKHNGSVGFFPRLPLEDSLQKESLLLGVDNFTSRSANKVHDFL